MNALKWKRSARVIGKTKQITTGESVYTSECGRFVIRQQKWPSRTWYLLDVDGQPAQRAFRESDTLATAKYYANLIANPNYDGE